MATSVIQMPEIRYGYLDQVSFDDMIDYKTGLYSLRTISNDTHKPSTATYFWILQIFEILSNSPYLLQLAVPTDTTYVLYMRKYRGPGGWTAWTSVTFS